MAATRQTLYSKEQPQSAVSLQQVRDATKSLARFVADAMGDTNARFAGLAASPGTGLVVNIAAGSLYQQGEIDPTAWGTLAADTSEWVLQGISTTSQALSGFVAPSTSGQSIDYLIEAQIVVTDDAATLIPFYNSANPATPTYTSLSPSRTNVITFKVKAGTAATTGTQTAPTSDSGWVPLYVVTVAYGETQLVSGNIALASGAPAFYGYVEINPNGNTPVFLSPASQQTGTINISGQSQSGNIKTGYVLIGGATAPTNFASAFASGVAGDYLKLTATGWTGSPQTTDSAAIAGSIGYTGTHAGTDADPYPQSQLNVAMLGGKLASDYALASGNYIIVYSGSPTAASGNAAITGTFSALSLASTITSGAPLTVASSVEVANLNAALLGGFEPGNSDGEIPVSNGTLNANLNAQFLNGLPSSAFQPAGSYAVMNSSNTGSFTATGSLIGTGGTGSNQIIIGYAASNAYGMNAGGAIGFVQSAGVLALIGSSVVTQGALSVGAAGSPANLSAKDLIPSGLLRAGYCVYTVTYGGNGNSYPYPGNGTAWGSYASVGGQIVVGADTVDSASFTIGYRTKITLASNITIALAKMGLPTMQVYVDGALVATLSGEMSGPVNVNLSSGTHTIDFVYTAYNMALAYYVGSEGGSNNHGGNATVFGWLPMSGGQLSSAITALAPG